MPFVGTGGALMFRYNQDFADVWSPVHAGSGAALGLMGLRPLEAIALLVSYELLEQVVEGRIGKIPETRINILGDLVFGMAGYAVARKLQE